MRSYFDPDKENYVKKQKTPSSAYRLHYHIVFSTKYRRKILKEKISQNLIKIILQLADEEKYHILGIQVLGEHIHIVVSLKPTDTIAEVIKKIKGRTSKILRAKYKELRDLPSLWTSGYSVDSLGDKNIAQIIAYLQDQQRHHMVKIHGG
jgi:putative transposase